MFTRMTLVLCFLISCSLHLQAQTRPFVTLCAGWPEGILVGLKAPLGTCTVGLAAGGTEEMATVTTDIAYHFAGRAQEGNLRPWYLRMPIIYNRHSPEPGESATTALRTALRFGYAWFPAPGMGVSLEAGPGVHLYDEYQDDIHAEGEGFGFEPGANLTIYIRI